MFGPLRSRLRAFLARFLPLGDHPPTPTPLARLEALEAAHQALAERVAEAMDDRVDEADKLYAKVRSALGRLYRLKGWEDEDAKQDAPARPDLAAVIAAKYRR